LIFKEECECHAKFLDEDLAETYDLGEEKKNCMDLPKKIGAE
jgi:hypothetical protein